MCLLSFRRLLLVLVLGSFFSVSGRAQARDVRIIGDSIFALSGQVAKELRHLSGLEIRSHAIAGATARMIVNQYSRIRRHPITTIVMDAGGNDVLLGANSDCRTLNPRCKRVIADAMEKLVKLFQTMHTDGVEHVVLLGYYYPKGWMQKLGNAIDYAIPQMAEVCRIAKISCEFVDPRQAFKGKRGLVALDGIHPTTKGAKVLGGMIWQTFVDKGIEQ